MSSTMNLLKRSLPLVACISAMATMAQWTPYNTQGYNSVFSVTTGPGAIYFISYGSGVIKSTNGGTVWNPSNTGLPAATTIESVYYNGTDLFCGTHSGVYRSTNAGGNWSAASTGLPASSAANCVKEFYHTGTSTFAIFNGQIGNNAGGIWRTTDNGANWFSGNGGLSSNMVVHQVAMINNVLYAATTSGIYTSANLGINWTVQTGSAFATFGIQGTASRLVAITTFGYRYRNMQPMSPTWTDVTVGDPANPTNGELILYDGKYWAMSEGAVSRSSDNGVTYTAYETGLVGADVITQYRFHASGTTLFLGALSNLYGAPGTTVGVEEPTMTDTSLPLPYPTLFTDAFTVDLTDMGGGRELVLIDAAGRELERHTDLPAAPVRIERGVLPAGTYRVLLVDRAKGTRVPLGSVIAQ